MADSTWIDQNSADKPKRKRAGLVCVGCHERKIKCDLQKRGGSAYGRCSNCTATGKNCLVRSSRRGNYRRSSAQAPAPECPTPLIGNDHQSSTSDGFAAGHLSDTFLDLQGEGEPQSHSLYPDHFAMPASISPRFSQSNSLPIQQDEVSESGVQAKGSAASYIGETGFLQVYSIEHRLDVDSYMLHGGGETLDPNLPSPDLLQSFTETYLDSCFSWCPVLDQETLSSDLARAPLLVNALSCAGSQIQPPKISHITTGAYYDNARRIFYNDEEMDPIICIQAICLFYWWSPRPSTIVHRDSSWWWTTVAIRHAQQIGLHREPKPGHTERPSIKQGLRRRIWWTLFARERLTAICQSRPCIIDPEDCDVLQPTVDDFPDPKDPKAEIFVYWIRLCTIIGRLAKCRLQATDATSVSPVYVADELRHWIRSVPSHLSLPIKSDYTAPFSREVHQLHLPYLAVIIILHLTTSSQSLPRAYPAALIAASCIARIFKDYLARGSLRFLMPVSCWYCGLATLALLRARRVDYLTRYADEDIQILLVALNEFRALYPVANIFLQGFKRLRTEAGPQDAKEDPTISTNNSTHTAQLSHDEFRFSNSIGWIRYFPFLTAKTSGIAKVLLAEYQDDPFAGEAWLGPMPLELQELLGPFDSFPDFIPMF